MFNYNRFHKQNKKIQKKLINSRNYVYQSLIKLTKKYFAKSGSVADIGCGVGTIDFYLANKGYVVTGIDVSSDAISLAKKSLKQLKINNLKFECENLEKLYKNYSFDYIICSEVIEHVKDGSKLLRIIYSILNNEGIAIISTPLESAPLNKWGYLKDFDKRVGHEKRYSKNSLVDLIELEGFEVEEIYETEGIFRNLLFTNKYLGFLVKFAKWPISEIFNTIDYLTLILFGASNIYLVIKKNK